jgi:uncharacterized peroxidase-related enzyme
MSEFTLHSLDTAPQTSKKLLQDAKKQLGFVPNLFGVMAESPAMLEAYQALTALFDKTALTVTERQLVLLSISRFRNCSYCLAAHGTIAKMQKISTEIIDAVYYNQPLADAKLQALRTFTREVLEADGWVDQKALQAFYQAGYQKQHVLDVVLGISFKTLSNYVNHINDTPIDAAFLSGIPDSENSVTV